MKASVFIGTSLDGYIARKNGAFDFLPADGGEPHGYAEFMATVDAIVMGRHTYEVVLGLEQWPYGDKSVIVLSTTLTGLTPPPGASCELMSGTPHDIAARLAARGFRHIYVDGGETIGRFLEAGLIQRLTITRVPVLIGEGIAAFGRLSRDVAITHLSTRSYPSGLVTSEYAIAAAA
jgi:dihydrofolate reductase